MGALMIRLAGILSMNLMTTRYGLSCAIRGLLTRMSCALPQEQ